MELQKNNKLSQALKHLKEALDYYGKKNANHDVAIMAVHKAFEVAVEYAWKSLKQTIENEGLEAPSPKEAIRQAAKLNLIEDPSAWIDFINLRNNSVHDYFSVSEEFQIEEIKKFLKEASSLWR